MTAQDMIGELESITYRLDALSEDDYFTTKQKVMLENAARYVDIVAQEAMDNV